MAGRAWSRSALRSPTIARSCTRRWTTSRNGPTIRSPWLASATSARTRGSASCVDRWDEDWTRLAWLRADGTAGILVGTVGPIEHAAAVAGLRARYSQYNTHHLEARPIIRITLERVTDWGQLG